MRARGVFPYFTEITPWGGIPGNNIYDVQSRIGVVNNYLMFDKPEKTVMRGSFSRARDPQLVSFKHSVDTYYLAEPSMSRLPGVMWTLLKG
jgi:hypothetical protein